MEGQFLVRQIYDDEITYNLISAAVNRLSKYNIYIKRERPCDSNLTTMDKSFNFII